MKALPAVWNEALISTTLKPHKMILRPQIEEKFGILEYMITGT